MSKQPPPAPTAGAVGPCPTVIGIVGRPGTGSLPSTAYVCACMHACVCPSGFVWVIIPTFMHGFQNYLTQFLFLRRSSVI